MIPTHVSDWCIQYTLSNPNYTFKKEITDKFFKLKISNNVSDVIFDNLAKLRTASKATQKWDTLGDYHTSVYVPVLDAFKKELIRLDKENPGVVANKLVEYLIGNQDFYKVIKGNKKVEIQAYNLHGTLNLPFENIKPKAKIQKLKLTTQLVQFNNIFII